MSHRGVQYVKQDQPAFLKKFKQKAGMKPEATIADKMQAAMEECVDEEKEDEKPVVIVLKEGDLTAEEAESHDKKESVDDAKIVFKKPTKRTKETGLSATTKKPKVDSDLHKFSETKDKNHQSSNSKDRSKKRNKPASSSLLSFDENDDG